MSNLYAEYVYRENNLLSAQLYLKGIHCLGCVRKIEACLENFTAIQDLSINLSEKKATIQWSDKNLKLDSIISAIEKNGFQAIPYHPSKLEQKIQLEWKHQLQRFIVAAFCTSNVMLISIALWLGYFGKINPNLERQLQYFSMLLTLPVLLYSGYPFFRNSWVSLKRIKIGMDFQIAFSALLMFAYSLYNLLFGNKITYFESSAMFITFILGSKLLEQTSLKKMSDISSLLAWDIPLFGRLIKKNKRETIPAYQIQKGMQLEVLPAEKVPADGYLLDEQASLDESAITGEFIPVMKKKQSHLYSGSYNQGTAFCYKVTQSCEESTMNKILKLLEKALQKKTNFQEKIDFFGRHFTNIIALISIFTFLVWYFVLSQSLEQTTLIALSVFIISCPCALVIATPLAFQVGLAKIAKSKAIFKSALNFEKIGKINTVVFDKTGSLTQGKPKITQELHTTELSIPKVAFYSLVCNSIHPVSCALKNYFEKKNKSILQVKLDSPKEVIGKGLRAYYQTKNKVKKKILGGNLDFMLENKVKITKKWQNIIQKHKEASVFLFAVDTTVVALYFLEDSIREGAESLITTLKKKGMDIYMCSGDRKKPSLKFASQLGIAEDKVLFQQSPKNKLNFIQRLQSKGKLVLMLGDGWNDAPALAQADLGLTLTSGTDATLKVADIILLTPDLNCLLSLFKISNSTLKLVRQNIILSIIYNFIAIPLAILGLVIPLVAALSMSLSSLLVVGNSFLHFQSPQDKEK